MKKTWKIKRFVPLCIGALAILSAVSSCSNDDDPTPEPEFLKVSTDTLIFTGTSAAQTFEIESTGKSWAIEISEAAKAWLNVNPPSGKSGTTTINVSPEAYNEDFPRFAYLLISKDGEAKSRVGISQSGVAHPESRLQDSLSLVALFKATNGQNWSGEGRSSEFPWDLAKPMNDWAGVECETINGELRVTTLDLSRVAGMKGEVPNEIGYLSELSELHLAADELIGQMPRHIILLEKLKTLYVSAAQSSNLKWEITDEYKGLKNLENLTISNVEPNDISTNPLATIYELTTIKKLDLGLPYISGAMQSGISSLINLEDLTLRMPNISSLASDLGDLSNLKKLDLTTHKVSALPTSVANWVNLEHVIISKMRSSMVLPSDFNQLVNLKTVGFGSLGISFVPNDVFSNMTKLENVYLNYNKLTGSLDWLSGKPNLQMVQIDQNEGVLSGELPADIYNYENLTHFVITSATTAKNDITGNLNQLSNLTKLYSFVITNANLTGEVNMPNSPSIYEFDVSNNNLTGGLDKVSFNQALYGFRVAGNKLSGEIPAELLEHIWDFSLGDPPVNDQHFYGAIGICPQQSGYGFSNCVFNTVE